MNVEPGISGILTLLQITFLDLVLGLDNSLVIGLIAQQIPGALRGRVIVWATVGAVLFRSLLTGFAGLLVDFPILRLLAGLLVVWIGIKLILSLKPEAHATGSVRSMPRSNLIEAIVALIGADLALSLDNVAAVAAVSDGNIFYIFFGLVVSVPFIILGSRIVAIWADGLPLLIVAGSCFLCLIGGNMIVSDPAIKGWINAQAPALAMTVPLAIALFASLQISRRDLRRQRPLGAVDSVPFDAPDGVEETTTPAIREARSSTDLTAVEPGSDAVILPPAVMDLAPAVTSDSVEQPQAEPAGVVEHKAEPPASEEDTTVETPDQDEASSLPVIDGKPSGMTLEHVLLLAYLFAAIILFGFTAWAVAFKIR